MAMEMKLQMRLSQQLIMTPQLQQAIKLLQLSRTELEELIEQSLIENPVLEEGIDIDTDPSPEDEVYSADAPELSEEPEPFESAKEIQKEESTEEVDWQQYVEFGGAQGDRRGPGNDEYPSLEATLAQSKSLSDHLLWQLDMFDLEDLEHEIGVHLIGNIGDDGYLTVSIRELLESNSELHHEIKAWTKGHSIDTADFDTADIDSKYQTAKITTEASSNAALPPVFGEEENSPDDLLEKPLEISLEEVCFVNDVLKRIQQFDPPGVGARSLRECLLVQLELLEMKNDLSYQIVKDDMSLLESKDLKKIARRHKESLELVIDGYKLIMSLEPKPGRAFGSTSAHNYIIPDVFIYRTNTGEFKVTLNGGGVPRLRISGYYRNLVEHMEEDGNLTKEYIQEKIKAGQWLMKSIEQRQKTIYRVTQSILKFQQDFFEKGINFLKPLVLKDVAEDINVHESTVSRITTNKYVHTPQGIFELKYFFTSGIEQGGGEAVSSKRIKDMIEQLIQHEEPRSPYTDLQIAKILYDKNQIRVARRTVAKYREALNILPSNKRKQLF